MAIIYLGLGSNLGNCLENLSQAVRHIQTQITVTAYSSIRRTKPMYVTTQPNFYNQVIQGVTNLSPFQLLDFLKNIEISLGRLPTYRYGPRIIDIDILYYDRLLVNVAQLQIPHPKNNERVFILQLMEELDPAFICPRTHLSLKDLLLRIDSF